MLAGIAAPEESLGMMAPLFGDLSPAAIGYNCVLAGCLQGELPFVLTAAEACLAPEFNLLGLLTTTGTPAVAVVAHGAAARSLGVNASTNCLGPGNRANACIGRALALVLRNIGGARAGVGDMATMGQPGKYTFCFAESDDPTLPQLHVRRGLEPDASALTVLGVSGTAEMLPARPGDTPELVLQTVAAATNGAITLSGREREAGEQVFLLPPELAGLIARHGWDLPRIQDYLFQARETPGGGEPGDIHPIVTGGPGVKMTHLPLWAGGTRMVTRAVRDLSIR